jgi:hypothetical protein
VFFKEAEVALGMARGVDHLQGHGRFTFEDNALAMDEPAVELDALGSQRGSAIGVGKDWEVELMADPLHGSDVVWVVVG